MEKRVSPCAGCFRCPDPEACENKNCKAWRQWFLVRWEQLRRPFVQEVGSRGYLDADPCAGCVCAGGVCATPCQAKRAWVEARENAQFS